MLIASFCSGCTYTTGTFSIPIASLNTALTAAGCQTITAADSTERLLHGLLTLLLAKNQNGTIQQYNMGAECSNASLSIASWETAQNVYNDVLTQGMLVSFNLGSSLTPLLVDSDTVTSI